MTAKKAMLTWITDSGEQVTEPVVIPDPLTANLFVVGGGEIDVNLQDLQNGHDLVLFEDEYGLFGVPSDKIVYVKVVENTR